MDSLSDISRVSSMGIDIEAVVDLRNYYSHFVDQSKKPKKLDGMDLYNLTEKLSIVFLWPILELFGLSHLEINEVVA